MEERQHPRYSGQLLVGAALMVMGILFLMENSGMIYIGSIWRLWPLLLVAAGIGRFLDAQGTRGMIKGAWLAFIGAWLYVSMNHVLGLHFGTTWPLLVIAWGITILFKGSHRYAPTGPEKEGYCGQ